MFFFDSRRLAGTPRAVFGMSIAILNASMTTLSYTYRPPEPPESWRSPFLGNDSDRRERVIEDDEPERVLKMRLRASSVGPRFLMNTLDRRREDGYLQVAREEPPTRLSPSAKEGFE